MGDAGAGTWYERAPGVDPACDENVLIAAGGRRWTDDELQLAIEHGELQIPAVSVLWAPMEFGDGLSDDDADEDAE